jgi:hypothetical protein
MIPCLLCGALGYNKAKALMRNTIHLMLKKVKGVPVMSELDMQRLAVERSRCLHWSLRVVIVVGSRVVVVARNLAVCAFNGQLLGIR